MKEITKGQIQKIHMSLPPEAKADKDFKKELVAQFSKEGKTSTKDLTFNEANIMIATLTDSFEHFAYFNKENSQHRKILALCHDAQDKNGNKIFLKYCPTKKKIIPDMNNLGGWIAKKSKLKIPLKELSPHQTGVLITQLEKVVKYGYEKI